MEKRLVLVFLLAFLSVTAFVNFFHTDEVLQVNDTCPACHFQNSIPDFSPFDACGCFQPALFLLEMLSTDEIIHCHQVVLDHPSSRAPPHA
jgi:hypothetical protein